MNVTPAAGIEDGGFLQTRLDTVCGSLPAMVAMNLVSTAMMALVFWSPANAAALIAWLVLNSAVMAVRLGMARAFLKRRFTRLGARGWPALLTGLTLLSGLSWGVAIGWMIAVGNDNQIMLVACITFGALAVAMANMTFWPIYAAFQFPLMTCAAIGYIVSGREDGWQIAAGAILIALIILSVSHRLAGHVVRAYRLAADNQALAESLAERGRELERAFDALQKVSRTDALTGLANRRARDERLADEWARAARSEAPLSVLAIDVDHFKRYNDTHGHDDGDRCLQAVAATLQDATREALDLAARYGGEEFMLILPGLGAAAAASVAERVRVMVARCHEVHGLPGEVTVSIGVATRIPQRDGATRELTVAADAALYRAKMLGRNRYETAEIEAIAFQVA